MTAEVIQIETEMQAAWDDYIARKARAEATDDLNDGIAAGHAWARWLALFVPKDAPEGKVLQFKRGER